MKNLNLLLKKDKKLYILFALIEFFIKTNKPVGSKSLKLDQFNDISSATIRNYCNKLEQEGYLIQKHLSSGRIPTQLAYREYINCFIDKGIISKKEEQFLKENLLSNTKEINDYLHKALDILSLITNCTCFISFPFFDRDLIEKIKVIRIDEKKLLFILITTFGAVRTEIIYSPKSLEEEHIVEVENLFLWKLGKIEKPKMLNSSVDKLSQYFYNEIILRHFVSTSQDSLSNVYKTGLSNLLGYEEYKDINALSHCLKVFENKELLQTLFKETLKINKLTCWIGTELNCLLDNELNNCSVITIPYYINNLPVGCIAISGPLRLNYKKMFGILHVFSKTISNNITKNIHKFKISFKKQKNSDELILLENKNKF